MWEIPLKETTFVSETGLGKYMRRASLSYIIPEKNFCWTVKKEEHQNFPGMEECSFYFTVDEMEILMEAYSRFSEIEIEMRKAILEEVKQKAKNVGRVATTRQIEGIIKAAEEYCNAIRGSNVDDMILKFADIAYQPK